MTGKSYKYRLNLHKHYFDTGYGITSLAKYFILVFGGMSFQTELSLKWTMVLLVFYAVFCYLFGWAWFRFGWYEQQLEVSNQFNLFVKEMRKVYKEEERK